MRGDCPIRMKKLVNGCLLLFALGCGSPAAFAQWVTQTITLNPGWNAVYLEVQPANSDCDAVFAGIPVESVWAWNRRFSSVQFIQDANQLVPGQPDWLVYLPSDQPARATRNLFAVQGARAYLIKLKSGAGATTWNVLGQPTVRQIDWLQFAQFRRLPGRARRRAHLSKFFLRFHGSCGPAGLSLECIRPVATHFQSGHERAARRRSLMGLLSGGIHLLRSCPADPGTAGRSALWKDPHRANLEDQKQFRVSPVVYRSGASIAYPDGYEFPGPGRRRAAFLLQD